MIKQHEWENINNLFLAGLSVPEISKRVRRSTTTLYRLIKIGGPKTIPKKVKKQQEILRYKEDLNKLIKKGVTNTKKLHYEIKSLGFKGSYGSLYKYLKSNKSEFRQYRRSTQVETGPGEQAQVDWGHFGKIEIDGKKHPLYCFVYVLSYSRALYIEFTIKQNLETLEECHKHAFKKLGIPKEIVYDNMKTVVIKRDKLTKNKHIIHYNLGFLEFADFYGFDIKACYPHHPRSKGKVEAAVKFIRHNFMQGMKFGRDFSSLEELNKKASVWLKNVANSRKHKATEVRPKDVWLEEKSLLQFPKADYETSAFVVRYSTKDGLIQYKSNFYSVPTKFSRRKLLLKEFNQNGLITIKIYYEDKVIATHRLSSERGKWIVKDLHLIKSKPKKLSKRKTLRNSGDAIEDLSIVFNRPLEYYE